MGSFTPKTQLFEKPYVSEILAWSSTLARETFPLMFWFLKFTAFLTSQVCQAVIQKMTVWYMQNMTKDLCLIFISFLNISSCRSHRVWDQWTTVGMWLCVLDVFLCVLQTGQQAVAEGIFSQTPQGELYQARTQSCTPGLGSSRYRYAQPLQQLFSDTNINVLEKVADEISNTLTDKEHFVLAHFCVAVGPLKMRSSLL